MQHLVFEEIDSTNEYLKRNIEKLPNLTTVQSYYQTHGKGRSDHTWESQKGDNLLFSILIKDFEDSNKVHQLTQVTAYAILQMLDTYGIKGMVKWPNDIYVGDSKIAGILIETSIQHTLQGVIIGMGINVNTTHFQSLYHLLDRRVEVMEVKNILWQCWLDTYAMYLDGKYANILETMNQKSFLKGKPILYQTYGTVYFEELLEDGKVRIRNTNNDFFEMFVNEISLHTDIQK